MMKRTKSVLIANLVLILISLSACTSKTSQLKTLINDKAKRLGVNVSQINILNESELDETAFKVFYSFENADKRMIEDSILVSETQDGLLCEYPWY